MLSKSGLVALADRRITSGSELSFTKKVTTHEGPSHSIFIMTSGLRSARDKALLYFDDRLAAAEAGLSRLYEVPSALAEDIRRVRTEDERWLTASGLSFNLHAIIGGQMAGDPHARMFLIYPEGNWIEITEGTPSVIIGASSYGKPLLDRAWRVDLGLRDALTVGLLAYDATRASAADVGPPIDAVLYRDGTFGMHEHRFTADELAPLSQQWSAWISKGVTEAEHSSGPLFDAVAAAAPHSSPH
jgi:putative proteasome-type protease